jgi:preprotein translocase subunit SecF
MEIFKSKLNIDFIGKRYFGYILSGLCLLVTIALLLLRGGPNYGVDFTGGVVVQVKLEKKHAPAEIREALAGTELEDCIIQEFGEAKAFEYLIRVTNPDIQVAGLGEKTQKALSERLGEKADIRQVEMVGPQVGEELRKKALYAIFYALLIMAVYISGRFEQKWLMAIIMAACLIAASSFAAILGVGVVWLIFIALFVTVALCWFLTLRFAMGAIVSLIFDVLITLGAFALTDREVSLSIVAALLTIVGYSINDKIVVYDRIRETLGRFRKTAFKDIINISINETLSRTILTGTTTLIVLIVLLIFGGPVIHDFAFALLVGIITGTYSSIFVASPILLLWEGKITQTGKNSRPQG